MAAGDSWDAYFGEVLQQQQTEVAELLTRIEAYCGQRQPFARGVAAWQAFPGRRVLSSSLWLLFLRKMKKEGIF